MIIGLTGPNASGKTVVVDYLKQKGFDTFSLSDIIRDEAKNKGLEQTRENLIEVGNNLRKEFGTEILSKRTVEKIKQSNISNTVVDSIRNPGEIEELKKEENFMLIGVTTDIETRFNRAKERGSARDVETLEEFKALEEKEKEGSKAEQQLNACFDMADKVIENNGTIEELHEKIDKILE